MNVEKTVTDSALNFGFLARCRAALDPNYLVRRARAQYMATLIEIEKQRAAFKAADKSRLNAQWSATGSSINSFLQTELTTMRNRSRWLFRNVPNAISGMNAFTSYCIGTGIRPISTVYDQTKKKENGKWYYEQNENDLWNDSCDELWDTWAVDADVAGSVSCPESFYEVQELVLRKWIEDGEAFVHAVVDKSNTVVPLYVEFFEPESLDTGITEYRGNTVTMGVELDKTTGRPVAYHVKDTDGNTRRYEARYIFHVFKRFRPGQVRGYPMFHGVTEDFFQLQEYIDATVVACKIAACMCMFIERGKGITPQGDFLPGTGGTTNGAMATDADGNKITHMQPGMIGTLPAGSTPHFTSPQLPGATFGLFTEHIQRQIGAGIEFGLSYEALTRNTSKASYAGGRLATQRDYQAFRQVIHFLNRKFNRPFRALWLDTGVTSGAVDAPGYFSFTPMTRHDKTYWARHEWIPPAWQYGVNPKDDVAASRDAMRAGMSTLDIECAFLGRDWRTVLRMASKVKKTAERMGLNLTSDGSISVVNGVEEDSDTGSEETESASEVAAAGKGSEE